MRKRSSRLGLGVLGLALLVSCSPTSEGSPRPAPTSDTGIESTDPTPPPSDTTNPGRDVPYAGAPKVDNPQDTTQYQQDPCQSLTAAQAEELSLTSPGEPDQGALGNTCWWRSKVDHAAHVQIAFLNKHPFGLSAVYQANKDGKWEFFEELDPIEGSPAVSYGALDRRDTGACSVVVGASDEIAFELVLRLSQQNVGVKEPCETAAMVAGMALQTMKAAQ